MMDPSSSSSAAATSNINLATNDSIPGDSNGLSIPIISTYTAVISRRYQHLLDKSNPLVLGRWIALSIIALTYIVRVAVIQGFYLVSYALGIYILNLLIAFLSPQVDPDIVDDGSGSILPTRSTDEYRPFVRRLPEFKFWYSITKAFCIAFLLTFFEGFDVPVFWPILVFYWFILFVATMKRQLLHMVKHKYVPFSTGKQRYGKRAASSDDLSSS